MSVGAKLDAAWDVKENSKPPKKKTNQRRINKLDGGY